MKKNRVRGTVGLLGILGMVAVTSKDALAQTAPWLVNAFSLPAGTIGGIIHNFALWLLSILGSLAIVVFVISGILYLTAVGDDNQIKRAKSTLTFAIVGVIVSLIGYVIIVAVDSLLDIPPCYPPFC